LVVEPTSLNRGEGLVDELACDARIVEGKGKGEGEGGGREVVEEEENERRSTVMGLMCV